MSLKFKTTAVIAVVLIALFLALTRWIGRDDDWQIAVALLVVFVAVILCFDLFVYRSIERLIEHGRRRLGGNYERGDPYYRDELRELGHLVGSLIAVFTAAEDKEWVSQSIKDDLNRLQANNRQLVAVAELGKEIGAALPYQETVERVLSRTKTFLSADFTALLLLNADEQEFALEGTQGVRSPSLSADCCAHTPGCPVRQAITDGRITRTRDHACTLFPHTMSCQLVIPAMIESIGDVALLATATRGDDIDRLSDDALTALRGHIQSALANAHKYDAIRRQVVTDELTGLYNRRFFMSRAGEEVQRSLRHQSPLSVLMVDIDHFKSFNDTYGHATGDRVLQTVAHALKDALRTTDVCARHGGEEFAVLLPNTPGDNAYWVADRVRRTLSGTRYTGLGLPAEASITISVGVATCPRDATALDELMELSDQALYKAKAEGRDRVVLYGAERREPIRS